MIREGEPQVTLKFLADSPNKLAISDFSDGTLDAISYERYACGLSRVVVEALARVLVIDALGIRLKKLLMCNGK